MASHKQATPKYKMHVYKTDTLCAPLCKKNSLIYKEIQKGSGWKVIYD